MPGSAGIESSEGGPPDPITVLLNPIGVDPVNRDHGKATVAGGVLDEIGAVGGADDAAGADKGFNAPAIGLADVVLEVAEIVQGVRKPGATKD